MCCPSFEAVPRPVRVLRVSGAATAVAAHGDLLAGCASAPVRGGAPPAPRTHAPAAAAVERAPLPPANPKLPPVPDVDGPLEIHVAYPHNPNSLIDSRDSTFVFGTVGHGSAGLRVN